MPPRSDPDPHYLDLATRILVAGKARLGEQASSFSDPDALADALIDVGSRELHALEMKQLHGRIPKDAPASEAQSVAGRLHRQPEPRVAQLVRQRVHADWMLEDPRLNRLADQVIELGLVGDDGTPTSTTAPVGSALPAATTQAGPRTPPVSTRSASITAGRSSATTATGMDPEAVARHVLDVARRKLAAAEGNHVSSGGDAAEVDAAFETFDPPIRRHALAEIVLNKVRQRSTLKKLAGSGPVGAAGLAGAEL